MTNHFDKQISVNETAEELMEQFLSSESASLIAQQILNASNNHLNEDSTYRSFKIKNEGITIDNYERYDTKDEQFVTGTTTTACIK